MSTRHLSVAPTLRRAALAFLAAGAALLAQPREGLGQSSTTRGLSLGASLMGTSLEVENGDRSAGGGFGLQVGYGFNRIVTGFLHLDGSRVQLGVWNRRHLLHRRLERVPGEGTLSPTTRRRNSCPRPCPST